MPPGPRGALSNLVWLETGLEEFLEPQENFQLFYYSFDPTTRDLYHGVPGHLSRATPGEASVHVGPARGPFPTDAVVVFSPLLRESESSVPSGVEVPAAGATAPEASNRLSQALLPVFRNAFSGAAEEVFEDGVESSLSRVLGALIRAFGESAVTALKEVLQRDAVSIESSVEAIRQLGRIVDPESHGARLLALLQFLDSPDPRVRDAASVGLAALDDPAAIRALRNAINREASPMLRGNIQLLLDQLEETQRWRVS